MKLVYIAGPYTADSQAKVFANIQRAREVADMVIRFGAMPITPHFLSSGIEDAGNAQFWYDATLEVLRRCDALLALENWHESNGALNEIREAEEVIKIPTFFVKFRGIAGESLQDLEYWIKH